MISLSGKNPAKSKTSIFKNGWMIKTTLVLRIKISSTSRIELQKYVSIRMGLGLSKSTLTLLKILK